MTDNPPGAFTVVADYRTVPSRRTEVLHLVRQLAFATRTEPGNLRYDVLTDPDHGGRIVLVESYRTAADFDAHRESDHFQQIAVGQIIPLLHSRTVTRLTAADG